MSDLNLYGQFSLKMMDQGTLMSAEETKGAHEFCNWVYPKLTELEQQNTKMRDCLKILSDYFETGFGIEESEPMRHDIIRKVEFLARQALRK